MLKLLDNITQVFTALVAFGAVMFVVIIAAVAIFGPLLKFLFKQWPF